MTDPLTSLPPVDLYRDLPGAYRAMSGLERVSRSGGLDPVIAELVKVRASQLNGCAYCIDMHHKDARAAGETEERLYMLAAWREATVYSDAERAALALAEAITLIADGHVPVEVEAAARRCFEPTVYAALVYTIVTINAWNRLAITGHAEPGHYRPGDHASSD